MRCLVVAGLIALTVLGGGYLYLRNIFSHGELAHKHGYSVLQVIYAQEEGRAYSSRIVRTADGQYAALAMQPVGESGQAKTGWLLLNGHVPDETVLIMPESGVYSVPCSSHALVRNQVPDVDDFVLEWLDRNCLAS